MSVMSELDAIIGEADSQDPRFARWIEIQADDAHLPTVPVGPVRILCEQLDCGNWSPVRIDHGLILHAGVPSSIALQVAGTIFRDDLHVHSTFYSESSDSIGFSLLLCDAETAEIHPRHACPDCRIDGC